MVRKLFDWLFERWYKSSIAGAWCKYFHTGIVNLTSTQYECAKCLRVHPANWLSRAYTQTQEKAPRLFICLHCYKHYPNLAYHYQTTECGELETIEIVHNENMRMWGRN